ncbi:MAG: hypothetical protein P8M73_02895 [Luminiphilus sp.]|jgi:hypothetical protein|nr:hypothetical protein [Luminiphilus sp.]
MDKRQYEISLDEARYRIVDAEGVSAAREELAKLLNHSRLTERDIQLLIKMTERLQRD